MERGLGFHLLYSWGLQASNGARSPIRRLEAPCFAKLLEAPRVDQSHMLRWSFILTNYNPHASRCLGAAGWSCIVLIVEDTCPSLFLPRPGPGVYDFGFRLVWPEYACLVLYLFHLPHTRFVIWLWASVHAFCALFLVCQLP